MDATEPWFGHVVIKRKTMNPRLYICVKSYLKQEGCRYTLMSYDLCTDAEVDDAFNELQKDLERARKRAKAAITRVNAAPARSDSSARQIVPRTLGARPMDLLDDRAPNNERRRKKG
jgi:hypothetical protein